MVSGLPSGSDLALPADGVTLHATSHWPQSCQGIVVFAHGSGSSRFSPRNRQVAEGLEAAGLATVLLDLLTPAEAMADERTHHLRFDIPLLGERLTGAVDALLRMAEGTPERTAPPPVGLFGASTGAAAALLTAAARPQAIRALVGRGGRPDLAHRALPLVQCPTLWIVGGEDREVLALNQQACTAMHAPHRLEIVPGASHLFEEPGALARVTSLAREWFCRHLLPTP